jgi:hypothetical protein
VFANYKVFGEGAGESLFTKTPMPEAGTTNNKNEIIGARILC